KRPEVLERDPALVLARELVHRGVEQLDAAAVDEERSREGETRLALLDDEVLRERSQTSEDGPRVAVTGRLERAGDRLAEANPLRVQGRLGRVARRLAEPRDLRIGAHDLPQHRVLVV